MTSLASWVEKLEWTNSNVNQDHPWYKKMSKHLTNSWFCINAIANSKPDNAIMKVKGYKPTKNKIIPLAIILYVKFIKICNSRCPEIMLAANIKSNDKVQDI